MSSFPRLTWQRHRRLETRTIHDLVDTDTDPLSRLIERFGEPRPETVMPPRELAIYLLQIAAEVEHELLAQYLYATYSIGRNAPAPASTWIPKLREIAREEMGHLITVQNLLMSLGAPTHLRRMRNPMPDLYPFAFHLEPLSLDVVKKYVIAESPADAVPPFPAGDTHRVGVIYAKLYSLFQKDDTPVGPLRIARDTFTNEHLADSDFVDPSTLKDLFATPLEWSKGNPQIYVMPEQQPADIDALRAAAYDAIHRISSQGEGPSTDVQSHFDRFLTIYNDIVASGTNGVLNLATDPQTATISDATSKLWAELSDVRYEVLLRQIEHALVLPRQPQLSGSDPRSQLIEWAVGGIPNEMRDVIRPIATKLTTLPTGNGTLAGMPLLEPASELPSTEAARWKLHLALIERSKALADQIGNDPALQQMRTMDKQRLDFVQHQIGKAVTMTKTYKIHPAIGLARIGDSIDGFYICPETLGAPPMEIAPDDSESPLLQYKDASSRIKRQAARFRIYEYDDDGDGNLKNPREITAADARIEWHLMLANTKAAARQSPPPGPNRPFRNSTVGDRASLAITPSAQQVSGVKQGPVAFDDGKFLGTTVYLGELRTDAAGRLLVLGGRGKSASVPAGVQITGFTDNDKWHDDVGDGPITATITFNAQAPIQIKPEHSSWVIVAPPDFAPSIGGMVTMYDIATQAALTRGWITAPAQPSFHREIFPILRRASLLRWVHTFSYWDAVPRDYPALSNPANSQIVRANALDVIRNNPLNGLVLTTLQVQNLQHWVAGNFIDDFAQASPPLSAPEELDRATLDVCVGGGFYPGIEIGEFMTDPNRYIAPLRLNGSTMHAGEMTERMAIPWQADFYDCVGDWWPSQRPDTVLAHVNDALPPSAPWADPLGSHEDMVEKFPLLGFIRPATNASGEEVFVETERDASIPR
jgi:L-lysine epsilon oxidase-like protein/ferritin-like protein